MDILPRLEAWEGVGLKGEKKVLSHRYQKMEAGVQGKETYRCLRIHSITIDRKECNDSTFSLCKITSEKFRCWQSAVVDTFTCLFP